MKIIQTLLLVCIAASVAQAGCPLGLDKLFQERLDELKELQAQDCGTEEIFANGECRLTDLAPLPNQYQVSSELQFSWGYPDSTLTSIDIMLVLDTQAWIGIGFGTSMTETDMIITDVLGTGVDVYEAYSIQHAPPPKMSNQNNVKILGYEVSANRVQVKFNRIMKPNQTNGEQPFAQLTPGNVQAVIFAYGKSGDDKVKYHATRHFQTEIALTATPTTCQSPRLLLNGVCADNDLTSLPNFMEIATSNATISWGFPDKNSVDFIYQLKNRSWFGIGFGSSMVDTDMVIAQIQDNAVSLIEVYSVAHQPPQEIPNQSGITLLGYSVSSNSVQVKFNKLLAPNIPTAALLTKGQTYEWITAYSIPGVDQITYHNGNHYGFKIVLDDQSSFSLF